MLTKKLTFEPEVLEILQSMKWENDGLLGILTCGQLDRDMYLKVNKALDALGGKWNRKTGGHIFKVDPRDAIYETVETGVLEVEKDGFFETPLAVFERMIHLSIPYGLILEPSAGLGAIADNLSKLVSKDDILCLEKNSQRCAELLKKGYTIIPKGNFLDYNPGPIFDRVYMNPPFEQLQDVDHVLHAYECLRNGGELVSVMAESAFFRSDVKSTDFRKWLDTVDSAYEKLPEGSFKESGTMVNTRLIVIRK